MLQGRSTGATPIEMSHDDFVETYGRSKSVESETTTADNSEADNLSTSTGSFTTIVEDAQVFETDDLSNLNNCAERHGNDTHIEEDYKVDTDMNTPAGQYTAETKRRNSKLHNMANRLARKSFRMMKRKTNSESPTLPTRGRSRPSLHNGKWNSMFKRSRSATRISMDENDNVAPSENMTKQHVCSEHAELMPSSIGNRRFRSMSYSNVISPCSSACDAVKRNSVGAKDDETKQKLTKKFESMKHNYTKPYATVGARKPLSRPTFLPLSVASTRPQPFSPEYDVVRKCDDYREEEQTRLVAIKTLLKRRRNSLKIKCDQFDKELLQKHTDNEQAKLIQSRLRQMNRKLKVVDQCIEEQEQEMKVLSIIRDTDSKQPTVVNVSSNYVTTVKPLHKTTSAKVDLILSLELYKLNLAREEKSGFNSPRGSPSKPRKTPLTLSASCDTLLSMDDTCVFDDASSVTLSGKTINSTSSSPVRSSRRYSAFSGGSTSQSPSHVDNYATDDVVRNSAIRSQSLDTAVTSDCDSGFDNGDALSRSDISLNLSFSKSTGSIASVYSHPRSASCQGSGSSSGIHSTNCFFPEKLHSASELTLLSERNPSSKASTSSTANKLNEQRGVDPSILAAIEDFEKFAEKTKRRLSLNGKLVPLKK